MGAAQYTTQTTPLPDDNFIENLVNDAPDLAEFFFSDEMFQMSSGYLSFLPSIRLLSSCLSVPCIIYNVLLLTVLISDNNFCSWQFFPMMLQSGVDAIGPGLVNIVYNIQLESKLATMNNLPLELMQLGQKVPFNVLPNFGRYDGYDACPC